MQKVNLIVSIDTECDKGKGWLIQQPLSFENINQGLAKYYQEFVEKEDIKTTFLISPEIFLQEEAIETLGNFPNSELGTHLHWEFTPMSGLVQGEVKRTSGVQIELNSDQELEMLEWLTGKFKESFGYRPISFRAGRFGMSKMTQDFLSQLGYGVDSSVIPHKTLKFKTQTINNWKESLYPKNVKFEGERSILEVPVSHYHEALINRGAVISNYFGNNKRAKYLLTKMGLRGKQVYIRPLKSSKEELLAQAESLISNWKGNTPLINIMFHSNELWPGASPYSPNEASVLSLIESLDYLSSGLRKKYDLHSISLSETLKSYS